MTEKRILANQCSKCGAPLVQRKNELFCEYCKTSFKLPQEYVDNFRGDAQGERFIRISENPVTVSQQPTIIPSQIQPRVRKTPIGLILIVIVGIFFFCYYFFSEKN